MIERLFEMAQKKPYDRRNATLLPPPGYETVFVEELFLHGMKIAERRID